MENNHIQPTMTIYSLKKKITTMDSKLQYIQAVDYAFKMAYSHNHDIEFPRIDSECTEIKFDLDKEKWIFLIESPDNKYPSINKYKKEIFKNDHVRFFLPTISYPNDDMKRFLEIISFGVLFIGNANVIYKSNSYLSEDGNNMDIQFYCYDDVNKGKKIDAGEFVKRFVS